MKQLALLSPEAIELTRLHEVYAGLAAAHETLMDENMALRQEVRALRAWRTGFQREIARVQQARAEAVERAAYWEARYKAATPAPTRPEAPALHPILKHLITRFHPDRWSQGQPAAQLAHEITTTLLALRARGEEAGL